MPILSGGGSAANALAPAREIISSAAIGARANVCMRDPFITEGGPRQALFTTLGPAPRAAVLDGGVSLGLNYRHFKFSGREHCAHRLHRRRARGAVLLDRHEGR